MDHKTIFTRLGETVSTHLSKEELQQIKTDLDSILISYAEYLALDFLSEEEMEKLKTMQAEAKSIKPVLAEHIAVFKKQTKTFPYDLKTALLNIQKQIKTAKPMIATLEKGEATYKDKENLQTLMVAISSWLELVARVPASVRTAFAKFEQQLETQKGLLVSLLESPLKNIASSPGDELTFSSDSTKSIVCAKAELKLGWAEKDILVLSLSGKGNSSDNGLGIIIHNFIIGNYTQNKKTKIAVNAIDAVYFFLYKNGPASFVDKKDYSKEEEAALKFRLLFDFAGKDVNASTFELPPNVTPETLIKIWGSLVTQKYNKETLDKLKEIGGNAYIQELEDAKGEDVNLDFFSVKIKKLPKGISDKDFFNYFRKHINDFIDTEAAKFTPYNDSEKKKWGSDDFENTVVHIDMALGKWSTSWNIEDGSVIVTKQEDLKWVFTTIYIFNDGRHPVSGNREFGLLKNNNGSYTFYTAGVDRTTGLDDSEINHWMNSIFSGADKLWNSLQSEMEKYIDEHGGEATENPDVIVRPNWNNAKSILK
jgi:hypothetical protein